MEGKKMDIIEQVEKALKTHKIIERLAEAALMDIGIEDGDTGYTITSFFNGQKIIWDGKAWRYEDGEKADVSRPCPKCGKLPTKEGHDACLGTLPGVFAACCGHGVEKGYVMFENGMTIKGEWSMEGKAGARAAICGKEHALQAIRQTLEGLPDDAACELYVERGINEIVFEEPWKHEVKEYALGKGMTITIKINGGARDGCCTEAEAMRKDK